MPNTAPSLTATRANARRLAYVGSPPRKGKPRDPAAWFTPARYIDSVRQALGAIDLDPFTSAEANDTVGAAHIFTPQHSAFDCPWCVCEHVRVFMNPPYSSGACARAVERFLDQYRLGNFREGIVLVNNATDTVWFQLLLQHCRAVCFTHHRISFWNADRKHVSGNTRGQAFMYFGPEPAPFVREFGQHGSLLIPAAGSCLRGHLQH